jgi:alanine racemase
MELRACVSFVKRLAAGERISYGLRHRFTADATVATLPLGYADGVPRRLASNGGVVLVGGRRRPIVGVVTMDQLMVDCGDDDVAVGDEAVLIGRQGTEVVTADEWAARLGTIAYEITCGISARVPRHHVRGVADADL